MASNLVVPVARIENLREHPNAAMLGLTNVLGYQMVVGLVEDQDGKIVRTFIKDKRDEKGKRVPYNPEVDALVAGMATGGGLVKVETEDIRFSFQHKEGELIVYFPADVILTDEWAEKFGVKTLLRSGNRVAKIALRGEPSFGLVVKIPDDKKDIWKEGDNVAEFFSCKKFDPPVKATAGDVAKYDSDVDPYFDKFTDIQNLRIFVSMFQPGEPVVVTEKIEGTNSRLGYINGHQVAGSMELRRKRPTRHISDDPTRDDDPTRTLEVDIEFDDPEFQRNTYWYPWSIRGVASLLLSMKSLTNVKTAELFGEVYGSPIQKGFKYDAAGGLGYMAFGLKINDVFLDWGEFQRLCFEHGVPVVPVLYRGPFDMKVILALAEGPVTVGEAPLREGIVVYPEKERVDPKVGRAVLKAHGYGYDLLKGRVDSKDV